MGQTRGMITVPLAPRVASLPTELQRPVAFSTIKTVDFLTEVRENKAKFVSFLFWFIGKETKQIKSVFLFHVFELSISQQKK